MVILFSYDYSLYFLEIIKEGAAKRTNYLTKFIFSFGIFLRSHRI